MVTWTEQSLGLDASHSNRNILVCEDANLESFPIRTASHIVHYSLPNELQTYLYRFITCFGYYAEKLERELLNKPDRYEMFRPISVTYFDDNLCDEFVQIYEVLSNRTQTEMPIELKNTVQVRKFLLTNLFNIVFSTKFLLIFQDLRYNFEKNKINKPLCIQLITRAKDCDVTCPYRHILTDCDDTNIPEYGFVNMDLLEVLAPNHFSVRVVGHKRRLEHKSKPVDNSDFEHKQFDRTMRDYYSIDGSREQPCQILIGQMYLVFQQKRPKRCRVISNSKKGVQVYLIDDGKMRRFNEDELYLLDVDFHEFPARATEIFVLGYVPNDNNCKWLPEAKQVVEHIMGSLKERDHNDSYLQAEVIRCFDKRLIVKDLKVLYKVQNQLKGKFIARNLIEIQMAKKAPMVLHPIFLDTPHSSQIDSSSCNESATHHNNGATCQKNQITTATPGIPRAHVDSWDELYSTGHRSASELASAHSLAFDSIEHKILNIPAAPANSTVSLIEIQEPEDRSEIDFEHGFTQSMISLPQSMTPLPQVQPMVVTSISSVDEIFGSLPENIQATEVLLPIKCDSSNQIDETDNAKVKENHDNWLIKFSDSDDEEDDSNIEPSPFAYVRLINSYDDL